MEDPVIPEERREAAWSAIEALPVALVAVLAVTILAALFEPTGTALILEAIAFEAALGGLSIAWIGLRHRGSLPALRLGSSRPAADLALGFGSGLALFGLTVLVLAPALFALVSLLTGDPVTPPEQPVLPADPTSFQVAMGGVAVLVAAPLGEEIFFRGFLFSALRRRLRFGLAAAFSATAFALFHVIPLLMPLMFFVGLALAYVYEKRGSLLASISAHAAFNIVGYLVIVSSAR